ncbi:MAG TPA: glycerophosphoryl diester phosphodiesterase membrane domain-containing protein, partial [Streptosporangiaceae bacterium]|nr:glycerophosphoryl diester phosphodiesterase membrane domain-containing protein [Streptosporangiaceae bacterium]
GYGQAPYGGPGYGRQGGPPAPKPGVIPLRPLGLGEILDGAFSSIRRNPKATLGVAAILMTITGVISAVVSQVWLNLQGGVTLPRQGQVVTATQAGHIFRQVLINVLPPALISLVLAFLVQVVLSGVLTAVIGRSVLGQQISPRQAWSLAGPRLLRLLLATVLTVLAVLSPSIVLGLVLWLCSLASAPVGVYVAVGVPGFFAAIAATAWLFTMFSLAAPAVILEGETPARAMGRSWRLVRRSFWRVFGILLLTAIIVGVAGGILQLPFAVIAGVLGNAASGRGLGLLATIISVIGGIAAGTLTRPVAAGVTVLLYVDMRMRKEGLDLALRSATESGFTGEEFASVWRPPSGHSYPPGPPVPAPGTPPPAAGAPPPW